MKIINVESMIEERVKHAVGAPVRVFAERAEDLNAPVHNIDPVYDVQMTVSSGRYENSAAEHETWKKIHALRSKLAPTRESAAGWVRAAAQAPSATDLAALLGTMLLDVTRRAQDTGDLTSRIATEVIDPNFPKSVTLVDFLPYIGEFGTFKGTGDPANLVEQKTGETDTATLAMSGLGWQTTLENLLFNSIHNLQKVNQAVAEAYTDKRNAALIGPITGATYAGKIQAVAAVQESGNSYDVNLYQTVKKALKVLVALKDYQTKNKITTAPGIKILCAEADGFDLERVIRGQLASFTAGNVTSLNLSPLSMISEIITYDQGMTNGKTYKGKVLSYPGITAGYFYMFVPKAYAWILTKRGLSMEAGADLGIYSIRESRLWYDCAGSYLKPFLGYAGGYGADGDGAIIKVAMPDPEPST